MTIPSTYVRNRKAYILTKGYIHLKHQRAAGHGLDQGGRNRFLREGGQVLRTHRQALHRAWLASFPPLQLHFTSIPFLHLHFNHTGFQKYCVPYTAWFFHSTFSMYRKLSTSFHHLLFGFEHKCHFLCQDFLTPQMKPGSFLQTQNPEYFLQSTGQSSFTFKLIYLP